MGLWEEHMRKITLREMCVVSCAPLSFVKLVLHISREAWMEVLDFRPRHFKNFLIAKP